MKNFSPVEPKNKSYKQQQGKTKQNYCQRAHKQTSDPGNESDFWGMKIHWVMMTM